MKHSDYLFTPCKACGEEFPDTSREQDIRPAAEVWERRSRHWRKAALELKKQHDALLDAAKAVVRDCPSCSWMEGDDPDIEKCGYSHTKTRAAIKLTEEEASGS